AALSAGIKQAAGELIACLFDARSKNPRRMIEEIHRKSWEIAGKKAYPALFAFNTPGCGVSEVHARDLIGILKGIPGFVAAWQASPIRKLSDPNDIPIFTWRDEETDLEFDIPDFRGR
ncbi:MAG: hypothetical protein AAB385_12115, partial [Planctomycetota bacterium]